MQPIAPAPPAPPRAARIIKLSALRPRPISWLLPGRVPFGAASLLAGRPGGGKSQFSIRLAADLSKAGAPSLFVGDEDGAEDTILPRVLAAGGDPDKIGIFDMEHDDMAQLPTDVPLLGEKIRETGAALVVIDPVQAHLDDDINPNVDASLRRATRPLARMAQETGVAVLLITHLRKSTEGGVLDRVGGSGGLVGACRSVLLFGSRKPSENVDPWTEADLRYAIHAKCNGAPKAPTLRCRIQGEAVRAGDVTIETSQLLLDSEAPEVSPRDLD
jgi:hypothetical protein